MEAIFLGLELTPAQKECAEMYAIGSISIEDVLWYLNLKSKDELPKDFFNYVDTFIDYICRHMRLASKHAKLSN